MLPRMNWHRSHLLGLEELSQEEIVAILDLAEHFVRDAQEPRRKRANLAGKVVVNLFFEPSTRTRTSFGLAARRLGADITDFSPSGSSTSKGETFIDTAKNIEAMGIDVIVVRHSSSGAPHLLAAASEMQASSTPATAPTSIRRRACSTSSPSASSRAGSTG